MLPLLSYTLLTLSALLGFLSSWTILWLPPPEMESGQRLSDTAWRLLLAWVALALAWLAYLAK